MNENTNNSPYQSINYIRIEQMNLKTKTKTKTNNSHIKLFS